MTSQKKGRKVKLRAPSVYVRILPESELGAHAQKDGHDVAKKLSGWTDSSVSITDRHQTVDYDFPKQVIPPEASQDYSYDTLLPGLLDSFLKMEDAYNVLYCAYGQTGTGKTHSIFGPKSSLKDASEESQKEWGIFPRTVGKILEYMDQVRTPTRTAVANNADADADADADANGGEETQTKTGRKHHGIIQSILTVGAIDFYLGTSVDLLNKRAPVEVDADRVPVGYKEHQLTNLNDLISFLQDVSKLRKSFGTLMNNSSNVHDGSSRSHCALILTLRQLRIGANANAGGECECMVNKFTMVDLAGAERPSTTGGDRMSGYETMLQIMMGKETTGGTGFIINYELHQLATEVVKATEQNQRRKNYVPPKQLLLPSTQFLSACFDGSSLLGMLICLSQANHCGWETWFSLQYGTTLSKLRCPVKPQPIRLFEKMIERSRKAVHATRIQLENTPETGTPASKYYSRRKGMALHAKHQLHWLEVLVLEADEATQ